MSLPLNMRRKVVFDIYPDSPVPGPCWVWTGALNSKGYSCVGVDGKSQLAHRVSYELHNGPIPDGLQIDHLCRNKRCINPKHLEAVTGKVNCERTAAAMKDRCKHGHPLAGPNVRIKKKPGGLTQRQCRVCELDSLHRREDSRRLGARPGRYEATAKRRAAKRSELLAAGERALAGWAEVAS